MGVNAAKRMINNSMFVDIHLYLDEPASNSYLCII